MSFMDLEDIIMKNITSLFTRALTCILLVSYLSTSAMAQTQEDLDGLVSDTKNDLLAVIAGGLAGAVLGLSTLSFVDEPKEHTRNIIVGASLGIIAGVGYVAFSQANRTQDMLYGGEGVDEAASLKFNTTERYEWHSDNSKFEPIASPYTLAVSFRY